MANEPPGVIGKGIAIRGNLSGEGDLIIEGTVEGEISLKNHLTIEETGVVRADIKSERLTIRGEMSGNIEASDRVAIQANARVTSDIKAPVVVIEDGARFKGKVDMDVELPDGIL
ncbi:MAG: polymer-forming cytoskeletal protein [Myxococcales bacterium]|nr:polymer-forming cytoskeletal protein [Myxococcales bacterium]